MNTSKDLKKQNESLNKLDEELSNVRNEIQKNKKRKLDLESMYEKEFQKKSDLENISKKELQRTLERQIDDLIRQIPFKNELRYDKFNKHGMQKQRAWQEKAAQLEQASRPGKLCTYCGEINGRAGFPCSCYDL
jgi:chromosome segregation ATPase